ncbi:hypothetical protein EDD21DRAFT_313403, partial [Dissophora ornata]
SINRRTIVASIQSANLVLLLTVCNIYAPAQHRPRERFFCNLLQLPFFAGPTPQAILLSDLNMRHHESNRYSALQDRVKRNMVDCILGSRQSPLPTFLHRSQQSQSTIDYIFLSPDLARDCTHPSQTYACNHWDRDLLSASTKPTTRIKRGKGSWRFNTPLMRLPEFQSYLHSALDVVSYQRLRDRLSNTGAEPRKK